MKFQSSSEKYLTERAEFSKRHGARELWSVIDQWPLYCGIGNLGRHVAILDILRRSLPVPGHIAEFGSWRGSTLLFMAKLLRLFDPHGSKQVHAFDSFTGLETFSDKDCPAEGNRGAYRGDYAELLELVELYGLADDVVIHKGLVAETLAPLLEREQALSFSMVYLDLDLYEPTLHAMLRMHPRLSQGGMFVLDEWNHESYPGEGVAVREFMERHGDCYRPEHIPGTSQPNLLLIKERC
ncbi:MAG: TylF/MycF/NovP-related O-methyltransferase [Humidesulfovibrio sp.]